MDTTTQKNLPVEKIDSLAAFFDLLAKFDFEDKKKEELAVSSGSLVSAPKGLELNANLAS